MANDLKFFIAVGASRKSKAWHNKEITWGDFKVRAAKGTVTQETRKEYMAMSKADQLEIKDIGGYVGGRLVGTKRSPQSVAERQLITLDIDLAHRDFWEDFCFAYDGVAALIHSTHKHTEEDPRYRLILPLDRAVSAEEYEPIARKVAETLGIDLFDPTTFEVNRLMFWGSTPCDVEYYFEYQDGEPISADELLAQYKDWRNVAEWAKPKSQDENIVNAAKKQENPTIKTGVIGAFCRAYTIQQAIERFLPDEYEPCADGRYTYTKGTTAGGLVVYGDMFAYSHHSTDPISNKLCNAFDLVRIHKFGHEDESSSETGSKAPSFKLMADFACEDKDVKDIMVREKISKATYSLSDFDDEEDYGDGEEKDDNWESQLEIDNKGNILSSAANISLIFENDKRLKGAFKTNRFDGKPYVCKNLAWRPVNGMEVIRNVDYSGVRNYIEIMYGISGTLKIDDVLNLQLEKNSFHPIKDYFKTLKWDKVPRVDTLLIDYFGADDNIYSREAIRKCLVGAVSRVLNAGCKFDLVLTLVSGQGTGKSTFISKLGKQWFSDTFMGVTGKEALEQLQGAWIIEIAELAAFKKAEVEAIKHFISKQEDTFRPAYARTSETFKRQCIFIGSTNNKDFLRDPTGNRRFVPVDVHMERATKSVFTDLTESEVDQIWAEALTMAKAGESLTLSAEANAIAVIEQEGHSEVDARLGSILDYLETLLPPQEEWDKMDIYDRRDYLDNPVLIKEKGVVRRDFVSVVEVWCECFKKDKSDMDLNKSRDVHNMLRSQKDWEPSKSSKRLPIYGSQRGYIRK